MTKPYTRTSVLLLAAFALFSPAALAGKGGGKPPASSTRAVTSTVLDVEPSGTTYRIHSDSAISGAQVYVNGDASVISVLQAANEWELDMQASPSRMLFFDFRDSAGGTPPFSTGLVRGRVITKCYENGGTHDGYPAVGNMTGVGSTLLCPAVFRFNMDNGDYYRVRLGWQRPETDQARITCTHVSGTNQSDPNAPCDAWVFEPSGADGRNYANLEGILKIGRNKTEVHDLGYFYMTFRVVIAE